MKKIIYIFMAFIFVGSVTIYANENGKEISENHPRASSEETLNETIPQSMLAIPPSRLLEKRCSSEKKQAIVLEQVSLQYYEESGWPYLHRILTNHTDKDIVDTQYCMLAYDKGGQPLKLKWHTIDSSDESAYECLYHSKGQIAAGETDDRPGGWSLYDGEKMADWPKVGDGSPNKVAYALYCVKQVAFSDGTEWKNPDYEEWFASYQGKPVSIETLESYYPFVQAITE